ncbi:hypothetical protein CHS0354_004924 [Potamilus streckersoni]|uniref:HAT C-terminal dimerisation domain-containing protein n=1 Tax=Potamilus streckersoni TaxID=2493646 RepID=A0AAE0TJW8_9BIVA|nr:hypothetical protein CHS0354_004924 [Potamilus streckersoni]
MEVAKIAVISKSQNAIISNTRNIATYYNLANTIVPVVRHTGVRHTAHYTADILRHLAVLCQAYQRSDIDFTEVNSLLHSTVEVLESLTSESGSNISRFCFEIPAEPSLDSSGFKFSGNAYRGIQDLIQLALRSRATYPCASVAAESLLVSPITTVDCERGFSKKNLIKSDIRKNLTSQL